MTDETMERLICGLNDGSLARQIFIQHLAEKVHVGTVWPDLPDGTGDIKVGYRMFFIRSGSKFVGSVLDMEDDLHIYLLPKYRGRGLMSKALKDAILPYLFTLGRREQKVTFQERKLGKYLVRLGFALTSSRSAAMNADALPARAFKPKTVMLDVAKAELLKQRMWQAIAFVHMCYDELATTGREIRLDFATVQDILTDVVCQLDKLSWKK